MELSDRFYYDDTSPSCLRWKINVRSGRNKNQLNVKVGDVAGGLNNSSGYYQVRVDGRLALGTQGNLRNGIWGYT